MVRRRHESRKDGTNYVYGRIESGKNLCDLNARKKSS